MSKLLAHRPPVSLTVSSPSENADAGAHLSRVPYLPWLAAALLGAVCCVLLGWLLVALPVAVGWLSATYLPLTTVLTTVNQGWLALHGVGGQVGDLTLGITPLGLTAVVGVAIGVATTYASAQMGERADGAPATPLRAALLLTGSMTVSYTVAALLLATLVGAPAQAAHIVVGSFALALVSSCWAAVRARRVRLLEAAPAWVRALPGAALAGVGVLLTGSVAALATALVAHWPRVSALQAALDPGVPGAILLGIAYLAYLPAMLLWAGSYVLGAGFRVSVDSVVTPGSAAVGLLPGFPPFGAVPAQSAPAAWAWLAFGVLAGAAAALVHRRAVGRTDDPWGRAAWQSAVAGAASGLGWALASGLARGDLGEGRLRGLGPVFPQLLLYGVGLTAAGAALAGLAWTAWARRSALEPEEVTSPLGRPWVGQSSGADALGSGAAAATGSPAEAPSDAADGASGAAGLRGVGSAVGRVGTRLKDAAAARVARVRSRAARDDAPRDGTPGAPVPHEPAERAASSRVFEPVSGPDEETLALGTPAPTRRLDPDDADRGADEPTDRVPGLASDVPAGDPCAEGVPAHDLPAHDAPDAEDAHPAQPEEKRTPAASPWGDPDAIGPIAMRPWGRDDAR